MNGKVVGGKIVNNQTGSQGRKRSGWVCSHGHFKDDADLDVHMADKHKIVALYPMNKRMKEAIKKETDVSNFFTWNAHAD